MYFGPFIRFESWQFEIIGYSFFLFVLWAGRKILGKEKTSIFFWGSLIWTLAIENIAVVMGFYDYFAYANYYCWGGKLISGFSGWAAMVLFVPLSVGLGWFTLSLPAFIISDRLLHNRNIWIKASFAAIMLVSFDMLEDPLSVVNEWWRWTSPSYYYQGVTLANYTGWFLILFYYAGIYEHTVINRASFAWLRPLEKLIFRQPTGDLSGADMHRIGRIFYFRTVIFIPIMMLTSFVFAAPAEKLLGNRYAPFNNVFPSTFDQDYPTSRKPPGMDSVVITDNDVRKVKGPRCKISGDKSETLDLKEGKHVQK